MEELFKQDIEALLQMVCFYENKEYDKVDDALLESIATKYSLEIVEVNDGKNVYYEIVNKK